MNLNKVPKKDYVSEEHGPVYNFFYSYKTHFYQLMSVNVLMLVFNIPMMLISYAITLGMLPWINSNLEINTFINYWGNTLGAAGNANLGNDVGSEVAYQLYFLLVLFCVMFLVGTSLICVGPFQAGFHQIYRNLHRQEGTFIMTDFREGMKKNWKQSLVAMIIGLAVTVILLFGFGFYVNMGSKLGVVLATVLAVVFFNFILIQNMVYQMIVSVDLPIAKIYQNAILFSILKLGSNLGLLAAMFLLIGIIPFAMLFTTNYALMGLTVFYYATFVFSFVQYMLAFNTGECIDEYIVSKLPPKENTDDYDYYPEEDEEPDISDESDLSEDANEAEDEFKLVEKENQLNDNE